VWASEVGGGGGYDPPIPQSDVTGLVADLENRAVLDGSNRWTNGTQTFADPIGHIPVAEIAGEPVPVLMQAVDTTDDPETEVGAFFATAVDLGGGVAHGAGIRLAHIDGDGQPDGKLNNFLSGPSGVQLMLSNGPLLSDLFAAVLANLSVAAPTQNDHAATKAYVDALLDYVGTGLFNGITDLAAAVTQSEGILDRWLFGPAVYEGADAQALDLAELSSSGGAPDPTHGVAPDGTSPTVVLVVGRTDPTEDGAWVVGADLVWEQGTTPGIFVPGGNGYRFTCKPVGSEPPMTWMVTMDDQRFVQRGGNFPDDLDGEAFRWRRVDSAALPSGFDNSDGGAIAPTTGLVRVTDSGSFPLPNPGRTDTTQILALFVSATGATIPSVVVDGSGPVTDYALTDGNLVLLAWYPYGDGYWWVLHDQPAIGGGGGAVDSVNGQTGTVVLDAGDVGADAAGSAAAAQAASQPLDADLTALAGLTNPATRIPTTVVLASDSSVTSSTTLANTGTLSASVANGQTIVIDAMLFVTGDSAGDLKVALTTPSGTLNVAVVGISNSASSFPANTTVAGVLTTSGTSVDVLGTVTGSTTCVWLKGTFVASAAGTVQVQHAQRTSSGTATTVKAGSMLTTFTT